MAAINSIQHAQIQAPNYAPLMPNEKEGRIRCAYARLITAGVVIADVITWFSLPKDARITGGWMKSTALGASVTLTLQDNGAVPLVIVPATSFAALAIVLIGSAATHAGLGGFVQVAVSGPSLIQSVVAGANPANGQLIEVMVQYVVD